MGLAPDGESYEGVHGDVKRRNVETETTQRTGVIERAREERKETTRKSNKGGTEKETRDRETKTVRGERKKKKEREIGKKGMEGLRD